MTMYYTPSEEAYVTARASYLQQERACDLKPEPTLVDEIPDISEAERVWKLLVDAANN
jgi:hypothetical protein